eukprot:754502-Hanusia_phi.AAC.2
MEERSIKALEMISSKGLARSSSSSLRRSSLTSDTMYGSIAEYESWIKSKNSSSSSSTTTISSFSSKQKRGVGRRDSFKDVNRGCWDHDEKEEEGEGRGREGKGREGKGEEGRGQDEKVERRGEERVEDSEEEWRKEDYGRLPYRSCVLFAKLEVFILEQCFKVNMLCTAYQESNSPARSKGSLSSPTFPAKRAAQFDRKSHRCRR